MRWCRGAALAAAAAIGCNREAAPSADLKDPEAHLVPVREAARPAPFVHDGGIVAAPPASSPPPGSASSASSTSSPAPFVLTELAPTQGELLPLLKDNVARAQKRQLRPLVEFYADWCAPCRAFQASLGDPTMIEALRGTFLIKLNLDDWHDKLEGTGYEMKSIPFFYLIGSDGRPTGKVLDGDKWGRSTVANMSSALSRFLAL